MFSKLFGRSRPTSQRDQTAFLQGAYRLHRADDVGHFTSLACAAFPEFADRVECFGADWLGRQFARDRARLADGEPLVLMLEPGTGEVLEIPASFDSFHEHELVEQSDAVAAFPFFKEWLAAGGTRPRYDQCVGYRVPLFLGGADGIENLEIADLDVYWSTAAQLLAKVRRLPLGTHIDSVTIK